MRGAGDGRAGCREGSCAGARPRMDADIIEVAQVIKNKPAYATQALMEIQILELVSRELAGCGEPSRRRWACCGAAERPRGRAC